MKNISKEKYYQVVGILSIAQSCMERLTGLELGLADVLEVREDNDISNYYGHVSDAIYGGYSVNQLLECLNLKVEE